MYSYLVTFHQNNGVSYQTVLLGEDLETVTLEVTQKLESPERLSVFSLKDKKNIYFSIILENVSCIEYELLGAEPIIEFEKLINISDETLKVILQDFKNDYVIAVSLMGNNEDLKNKFLKCLVPSRSKTVKEILKLGLGKIKGNDVVQAQLEIIENVTILQQKNVIKL